MRVVAFLWLIVYCMTVSAFACPMLEHASPKVGSTVSGDIGSVSITFSSAIFPKSSMLDVTDMQGNKMNIGTPYGKAEDDTVIATRLKQLAPGKYKVSWNVMCGCGSLTPGDYKFTVK